MSDSITQTKTTHIAFLASGKLYLCGQGESPIEHTSPFVEKLEENRAQDAHRTAWQQGSSSWNLSCNTPALFGNEQACNNPYNPASFHSLSRSEDGFLYTINSANVSALLSYDINDSTEYRLKHAHSPFARSIAQSPDSLTNAMSIDDENGARHIAISKNGFGNPQPITIGDVIDDAPSFHPNDNNILVYHSAGIGRNNDGYPYGLGPSSVLQINLETNELVSCISKEEHDYLAPKLSTDGTIYCLRRPWQLVRPQSVWYKIKETLLVPVRLIQFLLIAAHHISLMISNKPVLPGLNDTHRAKPNPSVMLWNRWMTQKTARKKRYEDDAIVPKEWTLVRIDNPGPNAREIEIAKHVAAFDVCNNGNVIYTNGSKIWQLDKSNEKKNIIASGSLVESVCAITVQNSHSE